MRLEELISGLSDIDSNRPIDKQLEITDIAYDSRKVKDGSAFVAIKGHLSDGHKYIDQAYQQGALVAFVEDYVDSEILQIKTPSSRQSLSILSAKWFDFPSKKLNVIGITATNGKTTTSFMVDHILRSYQLNTGIIGTVETRFNDVLIPSILTTPESRELQEYIKQMVDGQVTDLTMEVSSHAQEQFRVHDMDFDIVTFNNFSREHIDQHGSLEIYYKEKSKLILKAKPGIPAILNFDYPEIKALADKTQANVLSFSLDNLEADFGVESIDLSTGFAKYDFIVNHDIETYGIKQGKYPINLGIAGYSGVMNSMVAIIVGLVRGIPMEVIQRALATFKGVERRFEMIYDDDFKIIDDHYANASNIDITMQTIDMMDYNELKMLYAIRGCRGYEVNKESAQATVKWLEKLGVNKIYLTSSVGTVGKKDEVQAEEKAIWIETLNKHGISYQHFDTLDESSEYMLNLANKGDLILLAGCQGMDKCGKIILNKLANQYPERKDEILDVIKDRIV